MKLLTLFLLVGITSCVHQSKKLPHAESTLNCFLLSGSGEIEKLKFHWIDCKNKLTINATTLLMTAASKNQIQVMEFLYQEKQDINERDLAGDTALNYAITRGHTDAVKWLLNHGSSTRSFRKDKITPVMLALANAKKEVVMLFLEKPIEVEVNAQMEDGWTALFYSVRRADIEILNKLLQLGADPRHKSKEMETALDLAKEDQWKEGIQILEEAIAHFSL